VRGDRYSRGFMAKPVNGSVGRPLWSRPDGEARWPPPDGEAV